MLTLPMQSLFTKENITTIQVWSSAQTVILPQSLSPSLRELCETHSAPAPRSIADHLIIAAALEELKLLERYLRAGIRQSWRHCTLGVPNRESAPSLIAFL
jgi:hypothetical protein